MNFAVYYVINGYGRRLQKSVFEIDVEPEDLDDLKFRVGLLLAKSDLFDIIPIDRRDPKRRISWQRSPVAVESVIVV